MQLEAQSMGITSESVCPQSETRMLLMGSSFTPTAVVFSLSSTFMLASPCTLPTTCSRTSKIIPQIHRHAKRMATWPRQAIINGIQTSGRPQICRFWTILDTVARKLVKDILDGCRSESRRVQRSQQKHPH